MEETYAKAYTEVLEILRYIPARDYVKIPQEKILEFEINKDPNYKFSYDKEEVLEKQNILKETKIILAILFKDYFATSVQKAKLRKILSYNEAVLEEEKKKKYSYDNIFKESDKKQFENNNNDVMIVEYKENLFTKILNKFKSLLGRK